MRSENLCGISCYHPSWLQRFANSKAFLIVYGLLGTTQAMAYLYFIVTLTTLEKRFKIPSQTTGIILSGNEISQIMLSLILSYTGGQRNRPRWIAWGVVFCAMSCFILAMPHWLYGAGDEALRLTKEYVGNANISLSLNATNIIQEDNRLCLGSVPETECNELFNYIPLILIFLSQFVLGIGNTLYYSLGQTYLDDNTKKSNTPMMLAYAFSLRMLGPVVGFALGYISLNTFIDPTKTPLIDKNDPRWLGAWWLGYTILGSLMLVFAFLIGLFPKELKKNTPVRSSSHLPKSLLNKHNMDEEESAPLQNGNHHQFDDVTDFRGSIIEFPTLKNFPKALMRLLTNKLLMCNIMAGIFYILGSSGYMTFLSKYLEVQFHKSAAEATIFTGPVTLIGMVSGFLISGYVISKKKPSPKKLLFWNVIVGCTYILGQMSYLFLTCPDGNMPIVAGSLNITNSCNANCNCDGIPYSPVCHEESGITFFSPCHAGCNDLDTAEKRYKGCACLDKKSQSNYPFWTDEPFHTARPTKTIIYESPLSTAHTPIIMKSPPSSDIEVQEENFMFVPGVRLNSAPIPTNEFDEEDGSGDIFTDVPNLTKIRDADLLEENYSGDHAFDETDYVDYEYDENVSEIRKKRELKDFLPTTIPGACLQGCALGFYLFTFISAIINCLGATGKIGSLLVNYRAVSTQDKSVTQGLVLMLISLFALIPGPIIYGWVIDSTCLVWNFKCEKRGNCQLHDQRQFRVYINCLAMILTSIGVVFDVLVWHYGKNLDLYGEREQRMLELSNKNKSRNKSQSER